MLKLVGTDGRRYYAWNLEPGKFLIGRKPECDLYISDKTVSRHHAELEVESSGGPCFLLDLESHNGTMVNGQRIVSRTEIKPGDSILLGSAEFKLTESDTRQPTAPSRTPTASLFAESEPEKSVLLSIRDALQRLPTEVGDRPEVMSTLIEMANMLVLPEPKEELLERSLALVKKAVPAERLAVLLTSEGQRDPYVAACIVPGESDTGRFIFSRTIVNETITNRNAVLFQDAPENSGSGLDQSIIMSQLKSAMAVPLFVEGEVLGILYADTTNPLHQYNDDYLRLFATFGNHIAFRLLNYKLLEERHEKQLLEMERRRASLIQRNLLPQKVPELPGYKLHPFQEQCWDVGGDLYDFSLLPDGRLLFLVADVSGKGMGAALLMSQILASFRIQYNEKQFDLCEAVRQVSMQLYNHSAAEDFATLFIGLLNPKRDTITFCNAGHNPGLLVRRDGKIEYLEAGGTMIGAFSFSDWGEQTVKLGEGDMLLIFTDGVTEARKGEEFYGDEKVERLVASVRDHSPEDIARSLLDDIKAFVKESPRSDDITMLLLKKDRLC